MPKLLYNENNIELMRNMIENYLSNNEETGFSMRIDEIPVTPRSRDKSLFEKVINQFTEFNKVLTLVIYPNKSFNTIHYELHLNGYNEPLSGTEQKQASNDLSELRRQITMEIENGFLKSENATLKRENNLLRNKINEVEILVQNAQNKSGSQLMDLVKTIGGLLMGNSSAMSLPEAAAPTQPVEGLPVSTVKAKTETPTETAVNTKAGELAKTLQHYFSEYEQEQILQVLSVLKDCKDLIPAVSAWLSDIIEKRKQLIERLNAEQHAPQTPAHNSTQPDSEQLPENV
ncbi:MAG: hypothetical protein MUC87_03575 [Bacteroidia bacterium]|jgi:hypothetical protein|nr:hypothetical protein [Bacteroidia bacterium]